MIRIHLSVLLGQRKMSRADLSKATGIRLPTISEYYYELIERIHIDHLNKICAVLDCKIEELLEYVPDKPLD